MPMFAFFPWYAPASEALSYAEFRLLPFGDSGKACDIAPEHRDRIRGILGAFCVGGAPITSATLIRFEDLPLDADLDEGRRADLFIFSELLATSGIAARRLFATSGYQNRDNFRLIIQGCGAAPGGAAIVSRRRDGRRLQYWSPGRYKVEKPANVVLEPNFIDERLLGALLRLREHPADWDHCFDAVVAFNLANTDREEIPEHLETVLLISAFERLLECGSNERDLAQAVAEVLQPSSVIPARDSKLLEPDRYAALANCSSVREAWIRDFFSLRGSLAHGNVGRGYKPAWSTQAHLLIASFAFTLALKRVLRGCQLYEWTDADLDELDAFEALLCEDLIPPRDPGDRSPWVRIRSESARRQRVARAARAFDMGARGTDDATSSRGAHGGQPPPEGGGGGSGPNGGARGAPDKSG